MANKIRLARATKERIETIKETLSNYELVYSLDTQELGVKNNDGTVTYFGVVTELEWDNILNKPDFATVATSGKYADLTGLPDLTLKLDKNFASLPNQTSPLLNDVLVINRGITAQKITLGNLLAQVDSEIFKVVSVLPATGAANKIYLVPSDDPESIDNYVEWLWYDGKWERLGGFTLDLSNYYNKTQIEGMLESYVLQEAGKGLSTNDYTTTEKNKLAGIASGAEVNPYSKTELDNKFNDKVDKVAGSRLMTNAEGTKLAGIAEGAEVNVQSDWNITDTDSDAFIKNKLSKATKTEAEAGENDTKYMTPVRTKDAIAVAVIDGGDL